MKQNKIKNFDDLAAEFIDTLKCINTSGKRVTQQGIAEVLANNNALKTLFISSNESEKQALESAYKKEIEMFQSHIETLEMERKKLDKLIGEAEYQIGMESDFHNRLTLTLLSLLRGEGNEVYFSLLDEFKELIAENADIERREKVLWDIKNLMLKYDQSADNGDSLLKSILKRKDKDSPKTILKQLIKVSIKALDEVGYVIGNKYHKDIEMLKGRITDCDDIDYLLSQRESIVELLRKVTRDVQVEKEEITGFIWKVGEKLATIEKEFSESSENQNLFHKQDASFSEKLETEISKVSESFGKIESLDNLKTLVASKLDQVRNSLKYKSKEYSQRIEKAREEQEKLKSNFENVIGSVREKNRVLEEQTRIDPLTGIFNRRVFEDSIYGELERFHRYKKPFSLIFLDVDHFKKINDNYGHDAGDRVLKAIAARIAEMLRKPDMFARYGGEEFVVILPETSLNRGLNVANKIREEIDDAEFLYESERVPVTVSIGVTVVRDVDKHYNTIFNRVDSYMYTAKERGRNRVVSDLDVVEDKTD